MWFTLFIKGIEGLVAGLMFKYVAGKKPYRTPVKITLGVVSMIVGGIFMVMGYFGTQALFWGDEETGKVAAAIMQLPWDCLQLGVSTVLASLFIYVIRIERAVQIKPATVTQTTQEVAADVSTSDEQVIDAEVIEDEQPKDKE